jgi:alpha-L-fucosidase
VKFDARRWARLAKGAGMRYIVITTKHHDGFCLFDSKLTGWDVTGTPFQRDVMKELAEACRQEGLKICWYHSIMDWHHPDYLPRGPGSPRPWDTRPTADADFNRYVRYLEGQVRELVTNYGKIGVLWFDGEWEGTWTHQHGLDLYNYARSLDPQIIVNNRVDKGRQGMAGHTAAGGFAGDFGTPEQEIPATGLPGVDWETCMTMNDTWGFRKDDENWKSAAALLRNLIDIASKGGNFLLNVGPTAEGLIPEPSVERLEAVGKWMAVNGEAVWGTTASPFQKLPWGRATAKPGRIYLHVFDWPKDRLLVPGLETKVRKAYLLADPLRAPLPMAQATGNERGMVIQLPPKAPDAIASVVVVEVPGPPTAR